MPRWAAFAGVTVLILVVLLVVALHSAATVRDIEGIHGDLPAGAGHLDVLDGPQEGRPVVAPTPVLFANVAVSQGVLGLILLGGAWLFEVPAYAVGLTAGGLGPESLALGLWVGAVLFAGSEAGTALADAVGVGPDRTLRDLLAPVGPAEWLVLLLVVLPVIAGFEEFLFRGALIGATSAGFGISPWLLAAGSALAFALGHGAQGLAGIALTGALGFLLAAVFVLTGNLVVVVVAHYVVNVLGFATHVHGR